MKLTRVDVSGLKGAARRTYDLASTTLVVGGNGSGKTAIREAIDFVLGRDVAGVSIDGPSLRGAAAGDVHVSIHVEGDDGAQHVFTRSRIVEGDVFRKSTLAYNGQPDGAEAAMQSLLGDLSAPAGATWLSLSEDRLTAELAKLGVKAKPEGLVEARRVVGAYDGGRLAPLMPDEKKTSPAVALAALRDLAREEVNAARKTLAGVEGSTDRSRTATAADEVRPEEVARLAQVASVATAAESQARSALAVLEARAADAVTARRLHAARREALARDVRDRVQELEGLQRSSAAWTPPDPLPDVDVLLAARSAAADYCASVAGELEAATAAAQAAAMAEREAAAELRNAETALRVLDGGHCPTCRQAITADIRGVFIAAAERARSVREQAQRRADDATAYTVEQREELEAALGSCRRSDAEVVNAQAVHQQVERWNATQARLRDLQQAVDRARTALAEHQEIPTPPTTDDPELNADLDQARERIAEATESVRNARQAHAEAVARRERHARWRSDLAARAAAEEKVQGAKALFAELRRIETDVAGRGADELLGAAFFYTPPNFGSPAVRAGVIGLDDGRDFWSGPGLSAAQRLILATAIDRALDQIMGRRLRLALLEADPLDAGVIDHLLAALEGDVSGGALDNAIVITCHRPHVPAGWKVISTSGSDEPEGGREPPPEPAMTDDGWEAQAEPEDYGFGCELGDDGSLNLVVAEGEPMQVPGSGAPFVAEPPTGSVTMDLGLDGSITYQTLSEDRLTAELAKLDLPDAEADDDDDDGDRPWLPKPIPPEEAERIAAFVRNDAPEPPPVTHKLPAYLASPGGGLGERPSPVDVARIAASLSQAARSELQVWPRANTSPPTPLMGGPPGTAQAVGDELREKLLVAGSDPLRITPGGAAVWRLVCGIDEPKSVDTPKREPPPPPPGVGMTEAEIRTLIADLSSAAIAALLEKAGVQTRATAPIGRKLFADAVAKRGDAPDVVLEWVAVAAAAHPKRAYKKAGPSDDPGDPTAAT